MTSEQKALERALSVIETAWEELRRSPFVRRQLGLAPDALPDVSLAEAERRSAAGRSILERIDMLEGTKLPHEVALTLRVVRFRAETWSREAQWYWLALDPFSKGLFGLFLPTAYCGGWLLNAVNSQLAAHVFSEPGDVDRYLALVADYGRLVDQFAARTAGQAERGILMPKVQVVQARALLTRFKAGVRDALKVAPGRLSKVAQPDLNDQIERRVAGAIEPAFERALLGLGEEYLACAPETVGLGQYPGGPELYAELTRLYTTLDYTPENVHARGLERMGQIERQMAAVRSELGFEGDDAQLIEQLNGDPRWRAATAEGVAQVFNRYIERLEPRFDEYFSSRPKARYGVTPLPRALEASMTYGYFDLPGKDNAMGRYLFNARNLTRQGLFHIAALTYHELMPGHHLHYASQQENETLSRFRRHGYVTAYNEGWAEYAAHLAGEMGLYEQPEERYGRLVMDAFLTCRLVVDTGLNVLGWSLERARKYMREHGRMTEAEAQTESIRYACDIPGQALAYKLGDTQILALRERMRQALGARFDLKRFHTAILSPGALPLQDLEWHISHEIEQLRASAHEAVI